MSWDNALIIGGIVVPVTARLSLSQRYEDEPGGKALLRMADGSLVKQFRWSKLQTTLSASGTTPPGLEGVDFNSPLTLHCAKPQQKAGAGLVYALPAARRADAGFTPQGYAWVNGQWQPTALSLATNTATLTAVPGATQYRVLWYPQLTVSCEQPPQVEFDFNSGRYSWSWTAQET